MKISVLSSHTPSLFWFRIDLMKSLIADGHSVIAIGNEPEEEWCDKFKEYGIQYKHIYIKRTGLNPLTDLKTYKSIKRILEQEKPDKIFTYQAKTVIYGSLAANAIGIDEVYPLIAGLGSVMRGSGIKNRIIRNIMLAEYRLAFKASKKVFFQNNDDADMFINNKVVSKDKVTIINGSGVNLDKFTYEPLPDKPAFLFIGRLIRDKGLIEYLEACKRIKTDYPDVRCLLVGPYDSNPSAVQPKDIQKYIDDEIIEYYGEQNDVRPFLKQCSTYVLPSYHEGTPKTVLEAMATGRSIITTDAPGCRETVIDGYNGFLVPVMNTDILVQKMKQLIFNSDENALMARRGLALAQSKYDVNLINKSIKKAMDLR